MNATKSNFRFMRFALAFAWIWMVSAGFAPAPFEIEIDVAPNVLNIASEGTVVTVHTNIAYSLVTGASVRLNDVPIAWWKSDSRGQFVAKFNMTDVEELVNAGVLNLGSITLTLAGETTGGIEFSGTQTINVIDLESKGK
jgi:hypothetical protein